MTKTSNQRIQAAFKEKAFIPFITCGDPDIETTEEIISKLIENGASIVELGIPFSDPVAEGPTIQKADMRALANGVNIEQIFAMAKRLRIKYQTPFVMMTYANPVFAYGLDKFMSQAADCGIDGLIIPDAPYEEKDVFLPKCTEYGLTLISMVAPSSQERIQMIAKEAEGFIYVVSSLGVTGVRSEITADVSGMIEQIKSVTDTPTAIGFGISNAEQARAMVQIADGVIIGSAIVNLIEEHGRKSPSVVGEFAKNISESLK